MRRSSEGGLPNLFHRVLMQLGAAAALQHNGSTIAPLLNQMSGTLTYGDLTPTTIPRRFISYEWFKYVLLCMSASVIS